MREKRENVRLKGKTNFLNPISQDKNLKDTVCITLLNLIKYLIMFAIDFRYLLSRMVISSFILLKKRMRLRENPLSNYKCAALLNGSHLRLFCI